MKKNEPKPASRKEPAKDSRENVNAGPNREQHGADDFKPKTDLPGKTDSGPEPDVFESR
jgi:hypothetical protein